jgi:hypothetical protein
VTGDKLVTSMNSQEQRLANAGDSESRWNEPGPRSEAEWQELSDCDGDGADTASACSGGDDGSSPPSFLVLSKDNVNGELRRAKDLLAMWNYLEYKGRVGRTHVVVSSKDDPLVLGVMPASARCRYFEEGRLRMSRSIQRRLGRYEKVPGLMQTLTYDPKRIAQPDAWASFGSDTRRFINAVNQYRKRRGWRRLHYLWMVEVQDGTGYPHVHIFFPKLKWIAPLSIINGNWRHGRANIESPRKIKVNCAAYISKYLRKMNGWSDRHLALLWSGRSRMYGFSRGFSAKVEKPESEWRRWGVMHTDDVGMLESNLAQGGYVLKDWNKKTATMATSS